MRSTPTLLSRLHIRNRSLPRGVHGVARRLGLCGFDGRGDRRIHLHRRRANAVQVDFDGDVVRGNDGSTERLAPLSRRLLRILEPSRCLGHIGEIELEDRRENHPRVARLVRARDAAEQKLRFGALPGLVELGRRLVHRNQQSLSHRPRIGEALVAITKHRAGQEPVDVLPEVRTQVHQPRRILRHDLEQQIADGFRTVRELAGEHLVEHDRDRPDVGTLVDVG